MEAHDPNVPRDVLAAEVYIYVLLPIGPHGRYSLMCHPRRRGDTCVYFTRPERRVHETPGRAREVLWIPVGLGRGQTLTISEKAGSQGRGHFRETVIQHPTPFQRAPLQKMPDRDEVVVWSYSIALSDNRGVLAYIDPDVVLVPDP